MEQPIDDPPEYVGNLHPENQHTIRTNVSSWTSRNSIYVDLLPPVVKAYTCGIVRPHGVPPYGLIQFVSVIDLQRVIKHQDEFVINSCKIRVSAFQDLEMPTELIIDSWDDNWLTRMQHRLADMLVEDLTPDGRYMMRYRPNFSLSVSVVPTASN